jgi:protein gp37
MMAADWHTYLILTKRIQNALEYDFIFKNNPNWKLGVTVCNQQEADEKIPILLQIPAAHRWVSIEPMLGDIDLLVPVKEHHPNNLKANCLIKHSFPHENYFGGNTISWVVLGGETGPKARPMHPGWVRSIKNQCQSAGVKIFFKSWGEWKPWEPGDHPHIIRHVSARDGLWGDNPGHVYIDKESGKYEMRADTQPMCRVGHNKAGRLLDGREWNEMP